MMMEIVLEFWNPADFELKWKFEHKVFVLKCVYYISVISDLCMGTKLM